MLRPRKDFVGALPLNHAVVNLRVDSLVPHEIREMGSTLQTRVPDDVLGVADRRIVSGGTGGTRFGHFQDFFARLRPVRLPGAVCRVSNTE